MKTAIIFFSDKDCSFSGEYLDGALDIFRKSGFSVSRIEILSSDDDLGFSRALREFKDTTDNLIVVNKKSAKFGIKEMIAETFETELAVSDTAKNFVDAISKAEDACYGDEYALIPTDALLIPNVKGAMQGFTLDDKDFSLIFLPEEKEELTLMCEKYVIPFLESKYNLKNKKLTLKYFGDEKVLNETLEKSKDIADGNYEYFVSEKNGDFTINLFFSNYDEKNAQSVIRYIVSSLKEDIYAEENESLAQRLFEVLKLKNLKISLAESFTGGRIVSALIENSGASAVVMEGAVTYSNQSKVFRLGVNGEDLFRRGAVSSVVAYQMALGLLKTGNCDIAVATTGIAGPKSDDTEKPVGLCYIAVGTKEGIHTYKFNFAGNREEITEKAKNTALFLAIKKSKKM